MKCLGFRLYARDNGDNAFFFSFFLHLKTVKNEISLLVNNSKYIQYRFCLRSVPKLLF